MLVDAVKMSLHLDAVMGFVLYLLVALLVFGLYACLYTRLTPHKEWTLIREGNVAAAIALGGALIGIAAGFPDLGADRPGRPVAGLCPGQLADPWFVGADQSR